MDETTQLSYIQWKDLYLVEKPYQAFVPLPEGVPKEKASNLDFALGEPELVKDIRNATTPFTIEKHGFTTCTMEFSPHLFSKATEVEELYIPEVCNLLKREINGADRVVVFDWRIRKSESPVLAEVVNLNDNMIPLLPARHVHVDQTPSSAVGRVERHAPEELHRLQSGRVQIINVWRPLNPVVEDWPLAVCDASSVAVDELVAVDHVRRHYVGESDYLRFNRVHRWWYLSQQKRSEVLLMQMYDSNKSGGGGCPHASFFRPHAPATASSRESIEVRALVFSP